MSVLLFLLGEPYPALDEVPTSKSTLRSPFPSIKEKALDVCSGFLLPLDVFCPSSLKFLSLNGVEFLNFVYTV